jgi:hypothetical protein
MRSLPHLLALVICLTSSVPALAQSAFDAAVDKLLLLASLDPELRDALRARLKANCIKRVCREEDRRTGMELAQAGVRRLDGPTLVVRAQLLSVLLMNLDDKSCGALGRGSLNPMARQEVRSAMEKLGPSFLEPWMDMSRKALVAELKQIPPRKLTDGEARQAQAEFQRHLSTQERQRLAALSDDASDGDLCWSTRLAYEKLLVLAEPHRSTIAIFLAQAD